MKIFIREKDDYLTELDCETVIFRGDQLEVETASGHLSVFPICDVFGFQIIK